MRANSLRTWRFLYLGVLVALGTSCEVVTITVVEVASLSVTPPDATVARGDTLRLRASLQDASGNILRDRPVEWTSENPEVAEIDGNGLVRGLAPGTTVIRASSEGITGEASISVTVPPEIVLSESELEFQREAGEGSTGARTVDISNGGEGTLDGITVSVTYPSGAPTGWLEATLQGSATPTSIAVRAHPSGLSPGTYEGVVEVAASGASNSPQAIRVTFVVLEEDEEDQDRDDPAPCRELTAIVADLRALENAHPGSDLADKIQDVRQGTEVAYFERCVKSPPDRQAAAGNLEGAVGDMMDAVEDGLISSAEGNAFMLRLLAVSRAMAGEAIDAARARGGRPGHIRRAEEHVAAGDAFRDAGHFEDAAEEYTDAISRAEGA
jgi:hypothetical protein